MVNWNNERPVLEEKVSALGIGKAIYAAPDGDKNNARLLLAADGFHFRQSDFSDFEFNNIVITSSVGEKYNISFGDDGQLLINGLHYTAPTNQSDETIRGNKTYEGQINLSGGLVINSSGNNYEILVDENGNVKANKTSETTGENDEKTEN